MKTRIVYFFLCFFSGIVFSQEIPNPYTFPYQSIPFGDTIENVLAIVKNQKIQEDEYINVEEISFYGISRDFEGGLYSIYGMGSYLSSFLCKSYIITYSEGSNVKNIKLLFYKTSINEKYRLLMVIKQQQSIEGDYFTAFKGLEKSITASVGIKPILKEIKYQSNILLSQNTYYPGLYGKWVTKNNTIILLINDGYFGIASPPVYIYVDNDGWKNYLNAVVQYENKKTKEQQEKNSSSNAF